MVIPCGRSIVLLIQWMCGIEPHNPGWDKSIGNDGSFSREGFTYDSTEDRYICLAGISIQRSRPNFIKPRTSNAGKGGMIRYRASKLDCDACALNFKCCPSQPARKVTQCVHEPARDVVHDIGKTEAYMVSFIERRKVEMLFAHLKRYIGVGMIHLRGPKGATGQFQLAATAHNLHKLTNMAPITA